MLEEYRNCKSLKPWEIIAKLHDKKKKKEEKLEENSYFVQYYNVMDQIYYLTCC